MSNITERLLVEYYWLRLLVVYYWLRLLVEYYWLRLLVVGRNSTHDFRE